MAPEVGLVSLLPISKCDFRAINKQIKPIQNLPGYYKPQPDTTNLYRLLEIPLTVQKSQIRGKEAGRISKYPFT
jgi:hypothetical protein